MRAGLTVVAYITAKAGHEEEVRSALLHLVAETRKEQGCINYDLHQSQEKPNEFAIYENWADAANLEAHARSAHIRAMSEIAGKILERPAKITKWIMVSELAGKGVPARA